MKEKKTGFHYGYVVLLATILMNVYYACSYSVVSQFMAPILATYPQISRTQFSLVFSIHSLSSALYLTQFGKVNQLLKNENVPVLGGLGLAVGFFIYSTTSNIYVFYFGALLVGMCAAFFSSAITITLLNKWFAKGQATLLAVSMTVGALGGTVGSPIVGGLIGSIGYAATLRYIAIGMVAVTVVIRLLLRKDPAQLGIRPCFAEETVAVDPSAKKELPGILLKDALKTYNFYAILGVFLIFGMCFYATYSNLSVYMSDLGFDAAQVGRIFSMIFLVNAITMIPGGAVADWLGSRVTMITLICVFIACVAVMAFTVPGPGMMYLVCVLMGIAYLFPKVLSCAMVNSAFGPRDSATFTGWIQSMICIGAFIGSPVLNAVYDMTGSYSGAFIVMIPAMIACAVLGFTGIKKVKGW
ncbi:MAG: MFS transporter [Angelakisella sp.]|jgi:MFS family permease|nr:MFS transporter [Angelakisella sp.]